MQDTLRRTMVDMAEDLLGAMKAGDYDDAWAEDFLLRWELKLRESIPPTATNPTSCPSANIQRYEPAELTSQLEKLCMILICELGMYLEDAIDHARDQGLLKEATKAERMANALRLLYDRYLVPHVHP